MGSNVFRDINQQYVKMPLSPGLFSAIVFQFNLMSQNWNYILIGILKIIRLLYIFSYTMFIPISFILLELSNSIINHLFVLFIYQGCQSFIMFVASIVANLLFGFYFSTLFNTSFSKSFSKLR